VLHWSLARRAPSGPEINEPDFSSFVLKCERLTSFYRNDVLDGIVLAASSKHDITFDGGTFDIFDDLISFLLESLNLLFLVWGEVLLNSDSKLIVNGRSCQSADSLSRGFDGELVLEPILLDTSSELSDESLPLLGSHFAYR